MKLFLAGAVYGSIILLISCNRMDDPSLVHYPPIVSVPDIPVSKADTCIYVCGVDYPESYDWKRDTARDAVAAQVVLWCNQQEILRIPTDSLASAEADSHHLIGGKLYTEHCSLGRTRIALDGKLLLEYDGSEWLAGLLEYDGSIYTLGMKRNGKGFTLRKDGVIQVTKDQGIPFGGFNHGCFPATGALYEDLNKCCFGFWYDDKLTLQNFFVENGKEIRTQDQAAADRKDILRINGVYHYFSPWDGNGDVSFITDDGKTVSYTIPEDRYFPSARCGALLNGSLILALSSKSGGKPVLKQGDEEKQYDINGFLSGVEVVISLPN